MQPQEIKHTPLSECKEHVVERLKELSQELHDKYGIRLTEVFLQGFDKTGMYEGVVSVSPQAPTVDHHVIDRFGHVHVFMRYMQTWHEKPKSSMMDSQAAPPCQ